MPKCCNNLRCNLYPRDGRSNCLPTCVSEAVMLTIVSTLYIALGSTVRDMSDVTTTQWSQLAQRSARRLDHGTLDDMNTWHSGWHEYMALWMTWIHGTLDDMNTWHSGWHQYIAQLYSKLIFLHEIFTFISH